VREDCIEMISSEILTSRCLDLFEKPFSISLTPPPFPEEVSLRHEISNDPERKKRLDSWST